MALDLTALQRKVPSDIRSEEKLRQAWFLKAENLRLAWREFQEKKIHLTSLPPKAIVELTQNCNFRCMMCPQSWEPRFAQYHPEYNMSMERFASIADQLFPTAMFVDLRGFGESTILPHWPEIVDYLEHFPFTEWYLVTNLSLPRDDVWRKMMKLGFTLGFSCDGATAETFEAIRQRARFERIIHNLGVISDTIQAENKGYVHFISTIQKRNMHELRGIVELAHKFHVDEVQFKIVQPGEHHEGLPIEVAETMSGYVNEAVAAAIDLGVRVTFNDWLFTQGTDPLRVALAATPRPRRTEYPFPWAPPGGIDYDMGLAEAFSGITEATRVSIHQKCFKPYGFTYINYKAEMGTCNHMMYPRMVVMGDLNESRLEEIWNSPGYQHFRRQLIEGDPRDSRCQWCFKHRLDD